MIIIWTSISSFGGARAGGGGGGGGGERERERERERGRLCSGKGFEVGWVSNRSIRGY